MNQARAISFRLTPSALRPLFLALTALIVILGTARFAAYRADRMLRAELLQQARMVAVAVNQRQMTALSGTAADLALPSYHGIKEQLKAIRNANPKCRFLYLMSRRPDGSIVFNVDSEPVESKDYSPPGQTYDEASRELRDVFVTRKAAVRGPYSDRWGTWISAFVPVSNSATAEPQAVLGMDIAAADWKWAVMSRASLPAALAVIAVMFGLLAVLLQQKRRDIRAHQEVLRKRETQLRSTLNSTADGIFAVDNDGKVIHANRRFAELWQMPQHLIDHGDDKAMLDFVSNQLIDREGFLKKVQLLYGSDAVDMDTLTFKNGRLMERYSMPMIMEGVRIGRVWSFRDITARKRAEEKVLSLLDESNRVRRALLGIIEDTTRAEADLKRLAMAIEQAAEVVVVTDAQGLIQYANPAFEAVTGYTREEAISHNPRILKSGKHGAEFYQKMWSALSAGEVWHGHFINKRKDGMLYEEDAVISPVRNDAGRIVNYVAVKRDVTREVQLEDQLRQSQKLEAVGLLAGGVAHDFNNLIMGIMGYAELCKDEIEPDHPIRGWLDEITGGAQRSADITRQLLAFARKQTIAPKVLDLNDAVAGMLKLLRRLIGEDINLIWRPGANLRLVRVDPSQVDQLLANLCINARDAIVGVGEITLETVNINADAEYCARYQEAIPGTYVCLTVSDNGSGMNKETLAQIFEPFFTTKGLGKGTGLGLATVYGIVKQNNGFIHATSEPAKGTSFKVHLPQSDARDVAITVASKEESPKGRGETVLLVEDEKSPRVTCRLFLETLNYKVLVAETPGEALRMTGQHPGDIHLLLTDVVMPGMDGNQLAKRISAIKPGVKVLFMSGYTADVIAQRGVLDEGVHFISKPFTRYDLALKVRSVLDGQ